MEKSRTQRALDILRRDPQRSLYSVAKEVGMSRPVLSFACKRIRDREDAARELANQSKHESD